MTAHRIAYRVTRNRTRHGRKIATFLQKMPRVRNSVDPFTLEPIWTRPPYFRVVGQHSDIFVFELCALYKLYLSSGALVNILTQEPFSANDTDRCLRSFETNSKFLTSHPEIVEFKDAQQQEIQQESEHNETVQHIFVETIEQVVDKWYAGHTLSIDDMSDAQLTLIHALTIESAITMQNLCTTLSRVVNVFTRSSCCEEIQILFANNMRQFAHVLSQTVQVFPIEDHLIEEIIDYEYELIRLIGDSVGWADLGWEILTPISHNGAATLQSLTSTVPSPTEVVQSTIPAPRAPLSG
jgi:hypothetical protein